MEVDRPHLLHEARQVINEGRYKPNEEVETSQLILLTLPLIFFSSYTQPHLNVPPSVSSYISSFNLTTLTTALSLSFVQLKGY